MPTNNTKTEVNFLATEKEGFSNDAHSLFIGNNSLVYPQFGSQQSSINFNIYLFGLNNNTLESQTFKGKYYILEFMKTIFYTS